MQNTLHHHPTFSLPRKVRGIIFLLTLAAAFAGATFAQSGDRDARAAQWDGYKMPEGAFVRFVDREKGFSFWHPAEWKESPTERGNRIFRPSPQGVNLIVITDDVPDGYGVANYASAFVQGVRDQPIVQDSATIRRVMAGGLEWRELSYDLEVPGGVLAHQTTWMTAVGPRVYVFVLSAAQDEIEKYEPILKRVVMTAHFGSEGFRREEFENLRAKFAAGIEPLATGEVTAALIAQDLRTARQSFDATVERVIGLFGKSPDAAFDLLIDADPQVRAVAITALGKARQDALSNDALIWTLSDSDALASAAAAVNLAARGAAGLAAFKSKLPVPRALTPAAIVRAGIAFGTLVSRELIAEMLSDTSANLHLAALQLALSQEHFDEPLPYSKLFNSHQVGVLHATVAVLQLHHKSKSAADSSPELVKMLRSDAEVWAARALGEIAPVAVAAELDKRISEIDARLAALGKAPAPAANGKLRKSGQPANADTPGKSGDQANPFSLGTLVDLKTKPEDVRLAVARGQLDLAVRKIRFRARWNSAKDEAARRDLTGEINKEHYDLADWASAMFASNEPKQQTQTTFDAARFANAPATGETLFPKNTVSYVMSPNFGAAIEKLDAALSGVQMATVRDQMTFALILKMLKTSLADKTGARQTGDIGKATGIDLKSPMSLATWNSGSGKNSAMNSAVVFRVNDRARFERLLVTYQNELGDLNAFATVTAALSRFAGLLPAAVPVVVAALASDRTRGDLAKGMRGSSSSKPAAPSLKPFTLVRQEIWGNLTITVFDQPAITESGVVRRETIHLAYLGETAVIASSKAAMIDSLTTAQTGQASIAQSEGFAKARREKGEIVFFSDLPALLGSAFDSIEPGDNEFLKPILKAFGAEVGALNISPNSWQTSFNISLAKNEFTSGFQPFKVDSLAAPRDLLPLSTILYAGAMIDPAKMLSVLKKTVPGAVTNGSSKRSRQIDDAIEKQIVPQMQGEIAAAIISFKPLFDFNEMPAMVFAARLKSGALATQMRSEKLFAGFKRVAKATALVSPVVALGDGGSAPFAAVTKDYFLLAESVETLKLLEAKEKFSASRDFSRSAQNVPNKLALFATYNLESAFEEASKVMTDSESQQMLGFISALVHAFHSQRAFMTLEKDGQTQFLNGHLSVAFDREGRFSVAELAGHSGDFDLANALIPAKGLSVIESSRVEAMTLRVSAKRAGVAPRVSDDLSKFPFQKIESGNDSSLVVTTNARRIPENSTVTLPVTGAEFTQYLAATPQINSKAPEIIALGKQIAGNDKDGRSVGRKIGEWTHRNLKWKKVQSDAIDTLASREADCLEHSELYVALARSLGLPARVVTGAALSGGSFGAHAWVEVYLGKWVELDPTWGLMNHVDATHLRFDGDAFTSYAMLNQIELEVIATRRTVADFQRDPVRLVKEFSLDAALRDLAFDLSLTVEHTLGAERWSKLEDKQRAAVIKAFERTVAGMWENWNDELPEPVRVIRNETKGNQTVLTALRGEALFRLTLAPRDGAWFITEHEIVDDAFPEFADALNGALQPETRRGRIYEISLDGATKHIERMIAAEGEKPELLLLKSRILLSQRNDALLNEPDEKPEERKGAASPPQPTPKAAPATLPQPDQYVELLKQIAARWPNFAPGQLALGRELVSILDDGALSPLSKDAEAGIAALQAYALLVTDDPRVWRELGQAYEQLEKDAEAEAAYRSAIERDNSYLDHHAALVNFLLNREEPDKAKAAFARMLKASPEGNADADEVFEYLDDGEGFDPDSAKVREELLLAFPKEVAASHSALRLLADLQEAQNKIAEAIKSTVRAIAIEATAEDYESLSRLYRQQRRFPEALAAANQALKLDDSAVYIQFERACSLAQLGRKREAVAALKEAFDSDPNQFFDPDEPDLQPLATMPEFKALKEKMKESSKPPDEKPAEQPKPVKPKDGK